MKQTTTTLANILLTAILATSAAAALASEDEHDARRTYSDNAAIEIDDEERSEGPSRSNAEFTDVAARTTDSPHWRVTHAMRDAQGRISELHYVVPLHDMPYFGQVTTAITDNGLAIDYADGLFFEADADMSEPHYHFVQTFKIS